MALSLNRDTKLYVSTQSNVASASTSNTWEILVLDGYTFSQETENETVTLTEAGPKPARGQRSFNTAVSPAEFSIPTYIRPDSSGTTVKCVEQVLWEGLCAPKDASIPSNAFSKPDKMLVSFAGSNAHELLPLYMYFHFEETTYKISEATVNSAEIDFSIDGIGQITWSGFGTTLEEETSANHTAIGGWDAGTDFVGASVDAAFLKNRLTILEVINNGTSTPAVIPMDQNSPGTLIFNTARTLVSGTSYSCSVTVSGGTAQTLSVTGVVDTTVGDLINSINIQLEGAVFYLDNDGQLNARTIRKGEHLPYTTTDITLAVTDGTSNGILEEITGASDDPTGTVVPGATAPTGITVKAQKIYNVPITGGSITIDNGIEFLTPEELGRVNEPIGSFTGTRAVSGTLTAYLRAGDTDTGGMLKDLLSDKTTVVQDFYVQVNIGGPVTADDVVQVIVPHSNVSVPTITTEDVISTEIAFTGLGTDLDSEDEMFVIYND